jgi:hypothetical protein
MNLRQLGKALPNGEDYRPHEVQILMEQLWAEYVEATLVCSRFMIDENGGAAWLSLRAQGEGEMRKPPRIRYLTKAMLRGMADAPGH